MIELSVLAHAAHEAPTGGVAAALCSVALLAAAGIAVNYVADAPPRSFAVPVAPVTVAAVRDAWLPCSRRHPGPARPVEAVPPPSLLALLVATGASVGAALVHALVAPDHLRESVLHGTSLALLAVGQLVLAALLLRRPTDRVLRARVALSAFSVLVWTASRLTDIALVTRKQPSGALDVGAGVLEVVIVAGCLATIADRKTRPSRRSAPSAAAR